MCFFGLFSCAAELGKRKHQDGVGRAVQGSVAGETSFTNEKTYLAMVGEEKALCKHT